MQRTLYTSELQIAENGLGNGAAVFIPASAASWQGFRDWAHSDEFPETGRIAYLNSEIFLDMSGEDIDTHALLKHAVAVRIDHVVTEDDSGKFFPDGARLSNKAARICTDPDALFALWETLEKNRLRRVPKKGSRGIVELEGTPDWALEIVSDSSVRKDLRLLRRLYHKAGISEYWIIDARGEEIDFQILHRESREYVRVGPQRGGWVTSKVFSRQFRLTRKRDRVGMWTYSLEVRE